MSTSTITLSDTFWMDAKPIFDDATGSTSANTADPTLIALAPVVPYLFSPIPVEVLTGATLAAMVSEVEYRLDSVGWHSEDEVDQAEADLVADLRTIRALV